MYEKRLWDKVKWGNENARLDMLGHSNIDIRSVKLTLNLKYLVENLWVFWQFFSTGTYAIIGTMCVKSETCYEKYHEKKEICMARYDKVMLMCSHEHRL